MKKKLILSKSKRKGKRFKIEMIGFPNIENHTHHFGSKSANTFIDNATEKEKSSWIARFSVSPFWNDIHSPLFYSRILWNTPFLKNNIRLLAKKLDADIIVKGKL